MQQRPKPFRIKGAIIHLVVTCCVSFASVQKHKCSFTPQFLLFPIKLSSMLFRGPLCVKLRSCRRLDEIEAGVCSPARFHPKENYIFLALLPQLSFCGSRLRPKRMALRSKAASKTEYNSRPFTKSNLAGRSFCLEIGRASCRERV